jgi:hypothetical protein
MASRGFEPVTSQAKAKSSYRYTTCVFMSTYMIGNISTTSLTEREMCPWAISKCFGDLVSNTSA